MKKNLTVCISVSMIGLYLVAPFQALAATVAGNGYVVEQIIDQIQGSIEGNGYALDQSIQPIGGEQEGDGFSVLGISFSPNSVSQSQQQAPTSAGGTSSGGSWFYLLPPGITDQVSSSTSTIPKIPTRTPTNGSSTNASDVAIFTDNGSTCPTRIVFSAPVDSKSATNNPLDVKKIEYFLNTYEGEKLPINGVYEQRDVEAVKRWQLKYRSFILDPMQLKNPTGTVYTLSMRQIERQTTRECGAPIIVTACPFFKDSVSYGDRGEAVKKVQQFLNVVEGAHLPVSGVFGPLTRAAVIKFQKTKKIYVATFIPIRIATGNWYTTTRMKANETIGCDVLK